MYKTKNNVALNPLLLLLIAHIGRGEARGVARGVPGHQLKRENVGTLTIPKSFNQPVRYLGQFRFRLFSSANNYTHTPCEHERTVQKKLLEKKTSVQVTKVESVIKASITNITHEKKNENHRIRGKNGNGSLQLNRNAIPTNIWERVSRKCSQNTHLQTITSNVMKYRVF